jgi:hypothetical protein
MVQWFDNISGLYIFIASIVISSIIIPLLINYIKYRMNQNKVQKTIIKIDDSTMAGIKDIVFKGIGLWFAGKLFLALFEKD